MINIWDLRSGGSLRKGWQRSKKPVDDGQTFENTAVVISFGWWIRSWYPYQTLVWRCCKTPKPLNAREFCLRDSLIVWHLDHSRFVAYFPANFGTFFRTMLQGVSTSSSTESIGIQATSACWCTALAARGSWCLTQRLCPGDEGLRTSSKKTSAILGLVDIQNPLFQPATPSHVSWKISGKSLGSGMVLAWHQRALKHWFLKMQGTPRCLRCLYSRNHGLPEGRARIISTKDQNHVERVRVSTLPLTWHWFSVPSNFQNTNPSVCWRWFPLHPKGPNGFQNMKK